MATSITPQEFVAKWSKSKLKERSAYQSHFNDVCRLVGHGTPAEMDHKGEFFTFEAGASKQTGGQGWADVWYKGYFAWEYKGKHADLDKAYQQLLQYRESLENPPLLVVSDIETIVIHTNFTNMVKQTYELTLDDLLEPEKRDILRALFYDPERLRSKKTTEHVTQEAAQEFARLSRHLTEGWGEDPEETAHFLIRLLFCLFAEDIGLLPEGLFTRLVEQVGYNTYAFTAQLRQLFQQMTTGGWFGANRIAHFDGGLFDSDFALELDSEAIDILLQVARLDWSSIEPSILGTLFERSLDPEKRAQLGAHYTSKEDILLIVEPVLMDPLRRRWAEVREEAEALAANDAEPGEIRTLLDGFIDELVAVDVLDAACGSGNFLYVGLRQLLDLEKEVITLARDLGAGHFKPRVSPTQLHGIELNAYAHELAQATVWIGYIQWLHENGFGLPEEPILKPLHTILHMDAILTRDKEGRPVEPEWPEADVIIGNPPFLGDKKLGPELGHGYVEQLRSLYEERLPGQSDLVCYWFERARSEIEKQRARRVGLLATDSIRGGANRKVLERIKVTGDIFMAWSSRPWILDGAAVRVSMVGFDDGSESSRTLDGALVPSINPDLTGHVDLTAANKLSENANLAFIGSQKGGPFDISKRRAKEMLASSSNVNGRPNSDVIRPWINGSDITKRPRGMWIIDFGAFMPMGQAAQYENPFEYVQENVYPRRKNLRRKNHREYWWIHAESRPGMREALEGLSRFIATPRVSKYRVFVWQEVEVLADSAVVVVAREDDYFLGILQSRMHELWSLRKGTALEDRPRYSQTMTFETFPFPWPPGEEPEGDPRVEAIAEAARELVNKRQAWLNPPGLSEKELKKRTLTNLYNANPTWLQLAHKKLDKSVLDAYGWSYDLTDEEILERLLTLNLKRAEEEKEENDG